MHYLGPFFLPLLCNLRLLCRHAHLVLVLRFRDPRSLVPLTRLVPYFFVNRHIFSFFFFPRWALLVFVFIIFVPYFSIDAHLVLFVLLFFATHFFLVLASYFSYFFFPNLIHLSPVYHASSDCPGSPWDTGLYVGHR